MINRYTRENTQEYKDKGKEEHTIFRQKKKKEKKKKKNLNQKKKKDCLNQGWNKWKLLIKTMKQTFYQEVNNVKKGFKPQT